MIQLRPRLPLRALAALASGLVVACTSTSGDDTVDAPTDTVTDSVTDTADTGSTDPAAVVPLFDASTELEPVWIEDVGDAIVTSFADRGRDRHAREDQFQAYDHYLAQYWEYRTVQMRFVDRVAKGGDSIDVSVVSEWQLSIAEFRAWYRGINTVAEYWGNIAALATETGPGTFDLDHEHISDEGTQYRYTVTVDGAWVNDALVPLQVGQFMEFENSQFLAGAPGERQNYYGTTGLYAVGVGGLVPWQATGPREGSEPIDEAGWLGGRTTLPYQYSSEPDNHFMQMATNLSSWNGQPFVRGRRVHHTDMVNGSHDENAANPVFSELAGLAGPRYVRPSCDSCHHRNGRAPVADPGESLDRWVIRVGTESGEPHPDLGRVLQPRATAGEGEGTAVIDRWEEADGLRTPVFAFTGVEPAQFSARLAPQLVGMGLLEAIPEEAVLAWEDPQDADGDGISGRAQRVEDTSGVLRLGRFGWKAGMPSVRAQVTAALNTDMGVMTADRPDPDCGEAQSGCGASGEELAEAHLDDLVRYVSLLGVRARRDLGDADALRGEVLFGELGCASCHRPEVETSAFHPLAELRSQRIHPYTDLLLHDLGPEMADSLGEGSASGAEWRTAPLWGIGLGACVTGGVAGSPEVCTPHETYLHDGRARSLEEAIRWHGGEGSASRDAFEALPGSDQAALVAFLRSL